MGGFFGVASKQDCVLELFYGVDYHSHLGTRRGGMAVYGKDGFNRISAREEAEWLFTVKTGLTVRSII